MSRASLADLLGAAAGALGELAHLVGDHREAAAVLAGAGRLDGGVEGQQVRLLRHLGDDVDDLGDLLRLLPEGEDLAGWRSRSG